MASPSGRPRLQLEHAEQEGTIKRYRFFPALGLLLVLLLAGGAWADNPRPLRQPRPAVLPPSGAGLATHPAWTVQRVDAPKRFEQMEDRSLALDAAGRPHVAYGADFLYYAWFDGEAWNVETVDDSGGVGNSADLALDAAGHPHIAYYDRTSTDLRYAYYDGSAWRIRIVDSGSIDGTLSIALDAEGHPHITYVEMFDLSDADLKYAHYDGTAWHIQVIEGTGWLGWHSSLALDSQGRPHITYFCGNQGNNYNDLRYAYLDGTAWITMTVDTGTEMGGITGWFNSLALDSQGLPHVSYYDYDRAALRYAHFDGSRWISETVDNNGDPGWYGTSLALDAADHPHISYCPYGGRYNCGELRYASHDGTSWDIQVVDASGAVGSFSSLALDKAGRPRISYYDDTHSHLKYIWYDGTRWRDMVVDQAGDTGLSSSLALDSAGGAHIAYCRYDPWVWFGSCTALMYAHYDGAAWQIETADSGGPVGASTSLAVDAGGYPHVSYTAGDWTSYQVRYAYRDAQGWHVEVLAGVPVQSTSLRLDAAGRPHLTYYDWGDEHLKYAHFDGSSWLTQTVDANGNNGTYNSLALDAAGLPHVSYYANSGWELRYASYDGAVWHVEEVQSLWDGSGYTSLALDTAGHPHIGYYEHGNGDILYTYHDGQRWQVELVERLGVQSFDCWTSLVLDGAGWPHIAYYDGANRVLKYAHQDGSGWRIETVDGDGWVGKYNSLALDGAGRPCISYYDETNRDLKYACRDGGGYHAYLPAVGRGW